MNRYQCNKLRDEYEGNLAVVEGANRMERQQRELREAEEPRKSFLKRFAGRTMKELQAAIANTSGDTK